MLCCGLCRSVRCMCGLFRIYNFCYLGTAPSRKAFQSLLTALCDLVLDSQHWRPRCSRTNCGAISKCSVIWTPPGLIYSGSHLWFLKATTTVADKTKPEPWCPCSCVVGRKIQTCFGAGTSDVYLQLVISYNIRALGMYIPYFSLTVTCELAFFWLVLGSVCMSTQIKLMEHY